MLNEALVPSRIRPATTPRRCCTTSTPASGPRPAPRAWARGRPRAPPPRGAPAVPAPRGGRHAELPLEVPLLHADRGLRQVQLARGPGEGAVARHRLEGLELGQAPPHAQSLDYGQH